MNEITKVGLVNENEYYRTMNESVYFFSCDMFSKLNLSSYCQNLLRFVAEKSTLHFVMTDKVIWIKEEWNDYYDEDDAGFMMILNWLLWSERERIIKDTELTSEWNEV